MRGFLIKRGFLDGGVGWKVARVCAKGTFLRYYMAGKLLASGRGRIIDQRTKIIGGLSVSFWIERFTTQAYTIFMECGGELSACLCYAERCL